jgi:hypothetical protein
MIDLLYLTDPEEGDIPDISLQVDGKFVRYRPTRQQFLRLYADAGKYIARLLNETDS